MSEKLWFSICSMHGGARDPDCPRCNVGHWIDSDDLARSHELFENDYAEWYRQHNTHKSDHEIPSDSAWSTWEQLTGKTRPGKVEP